MQALEDSRVINALAVNKDAIIELQEMNMSNAAEAHEKFLQFCNDQVSLLVCGQTLSSHAKSTGLGSGVANLQGAVREDIIRYDQMCLNNVLRHQLFSQYLQINGIEGNVPTITWGGSSTVQDAKDMAITLYNLNQAGFTPDDASIEDLNIKFGFQLKRLAETEQSGSQQPPVEDEKPDEPQDNEA